VSFAHKKLASCFILSTKTSGTDIDFPFSPVYDNCCSMNIRQPLSPGMLLRVAHTMPKLDSFTTNITLHGKIS
jgi:hypothetical protein